MLYTTQYGTVISKGCAGDVPWKIVCIVLGGLAKQGAPETLPYESGRKRKVLTALLKIENFHVLILLLPVMDTHDTSTH